MQDGRFITNYSSNRTFEQNIRNINHIGSAYDYKNFLQKNANTIINNERNYMINNNTCNIDGNCSIPLCKLK
jgi:hypothetical protein